MVSVVPMPSRNVAVSSSAGVSRPVAVSTVKPAPTITWKTCTATSSFRRSTMSASAPEGNASTKVGSIAAACTNPTNVAALGSSTNSHWAPTVCIQVPIMLNSWAVHSARKARTRNGAHAETGSTVLLLAIRHPHSPGKDRPAEAPTPAGADPPGSHAIPVDAELPIGFSEESHQGRGGRSLISSVDGGATGAFDGTSD